MNYNYCTKTDKKFFDSSLDLKNVMLEIEKVEKMRELDIADLLCAFNDYGFVVLQCKDLRAQSNDLLKLSKIFGRVVKHNRTDHRGIVSISIQPGYPDYLGTSNKPHPLHTDGSFLKNPPKIMVLQCEIADLDGGFTNLISCKAIYQYLKRYNPKGLELLFSPDVFTIKRDNESATRAIFESQNGRVSMAFRTNDGQAKVSVIEGVQDVMNSILSFISNADNQLTFKLEKGQILITDNLSILHGRTSFPKYSPRKLNRVYFDGQSDYCSHILFGFEAVAYE